MILNMQVFVGGKTPEDIGALLVGVVGEIERGATSGPVWDSDYNVWGSWWIGLPAAEPVKADTP